MIARVAETAASTAPSAAQTATTVASAAGGPIPTSAAPGTGGAVAPAPARPTPITTAFHAIVPDARVATKPEEPPKAEPEKPAEKPVEEKKVRASQFAALARQERALVAKKQELSQIQEQLRTEYQEVERFRALKEQAKLNPVEFLSTVGVSYDDLTQFLLQGKPPEANVVQQRVEALEKARQADVERQKAQMQAEAKRVLEDHDANAVGFVKANADKYELTNLFNAQHEIPELIKLTYRRTFEQSRRDPTVEPRILSFEEAADLVEKHYEEQATKFSASKKFSARVAPPAQVNGADKRTEPAAEPRTLTNDLTVSAAGSVPPRTLTEDERIQNALRVAASFKK